MAVPRHPVPEPFDEGMLAVGDGNIVYWCVRGDPQGKPAVLLHGGPGSGSSPLTPGLFDPTSYLIVQFDQRNCGRSSPHAARPEVDLTGNTTGHLVADIELLREHLGIERWLVWGASWGTTLALAYAEDHPDHVTEVILAGVGTTTAAEVDWITRSMGRVFPEAWERFVDGVPEGERDGNLAAAYARLLRSPDAAVREEAARRWCEWEDTHVSTYPGWTHDTRYDDPVFRMCFARLVTHYWANAAFLPDGRLMDGVHRIAHIPAVLVSGRLDVSSPPEIAWRLCRRWPAAELVLVAEGHPGGASTTEALLEAARRFAPSRGTGSRSAADLSIPSQ